MRKGWEMKRMGDVCDIINGGTPDTTVRKFWDGDNLWITPKDMGRLESIYVDDTLRKITDEGLKNSSAKILPIDSIILSSRAPIGHLAINKKPISTNQGCKGLVPKKGISTLYVYYFLSSSIDLLNSLGTGTTFKELSGSKLETVEIPLPPLPEQKRIVAILDETFAAIDKAKANVQRNMQNARDLFESYLEKVFAYPRSEWESNLLGEICEFTQGLQMDVNLQTEQQKENQVRFLRIVDFTQGNEMPRYIDNPGEKYIINENDISLVRYGASTGFVCRGLSGVLANNLFRVIPKSSKHISNDFLFVFLKSNLFQNIIRESMNGAAMPAISFGMIKDIPIPVMSINEQNIIVKNTDAISIETKKLESIYQQKLNDLEELKKSILQKAFAGELTK